MTLRPGLLILCLIAVTAPWAAFSTALTNVVKLMFPITIVVTLLFMTIAGRKLYLGRPFVAMALYCCLIASSILWTMAPAIWHLVVIVWAFNLIVFVGVLNFVTDDRSLRLFAYASALGATICLPLLQPYDGHGLLDSSRYAVPGLNANYTAYVLAGAFFVIALCLRYQRVKKLNRIALYLVLAVIFYQLLLLGTRGAQLSVILSGMVLFVGRLVPRSAAALAAVSVLVIGVSFSTGLLTPFLAWIDSFSERSTGDLSGRLIIWSDAMNYIIAHPVVGIGPGSFDSVGALRIGAHNIVLIVLLDTGMLGLVVFGWFIMEVWRAILKVGHEGPRIFLALLMHWLPMALSGHWEGAAYSWGVIAVAISLARIRAQSAQPTQVPVAQPA